MKLHNGSFIVVAGALVLLGAGGILIVAPTAIKSDRAEVAQARQGHPRAVEGYGKLPLSFEVNQGQTDAQVKFLARGQGYTLFLTSQDALLSLRKSEANSQKKREELASPRAELAGDRFALFKDRLLQATELREPKGGEGARNAVVQMRLASAKTNAMVKGEQELPGKSNYFLGNDPKKWRTNIPTYAKVRVEGIYPGVDLVYYGNQGQLEYDFVVRPGADPSAIKLALASSPSPKGNGSPGSTDSFEVTSPKIDADGDLVVPQDGAEVRFHRPVIYQPASAESERRTTEKTLITGRYTVNDQNEVAFAIGEYDRTRPLIIDPVLAYSTYLAGTGGDGANAITVDSSGNAYVTGITGSTDFPTMNALQTTNHGGQDAFVAKLNADGSALVYSTYLGGSGYDQSNGIAVDSSGNAYVTGYTGSTDFPTVNPLQATNHGGQDAFVAKLNADGSALVYSTYLGGSGTDQSNGIAVDNSGNAYVTGYTGSADFPTMNPVQGTNHGGRDAFVAKLNGDGSALVYSTYLGGANDDWSNGIAVDSSGNAYVTGYTSSTDFPTANPFQAKNHSGDFYTINGFVTKLNLSGSALVYSTYLGGSIYDYGTAIAVDASGSAYVTGVAGSTNFPTAFPLQPLNNDQYGNNNAFVTKFNASGSALVYSTYLGGSGSGFAGDMGLGITVDASGDAYVTGVANSIDFPTANAIQGANHGIPDAFVTEINSTGSALVYSTYLGGSVWDGGYAIATDAYGDAFVTGVTTSTDFPTTANSFQPAHPGGGFVSKISPATAVAELTITNTAPLSVQSGSTLTYTIVVTNAGPDAAIDVRIDDSFPVDATCLHYCFLDGTFISATVSSGSCAPPALGVGSGSTERITCIVPILASGDTVTATVVFGDAHGLPVIKGTATVDSATFDPTTADNSATATTILN